MVMGQIVSSLELYCQILYCILMSKNSRKFCRKEKIRSRGGHYSPATLRRHGEATNQKRYSLLHTRLYAGRCMSRPAKFSVFVRFGGVSQKPRSVASLGRDVQSTKNTSSLAGSILTLYFTLSRAYKTTHILR